MIEVNLAAAWVMFLLGGLSGVLLGMRFRDESFLGGYGSWRRRLARLGHISFFGIGLLNIAACATLHIAGISEGVTGVCVLLLWAGLTMPTVCFLSAWREVFRALFFVPVGAVLIASGWIVVLLVGSGTGGML